MTKKLPYPTTYALIRGKPMTQDDDGIKTPSRPQLALWWAKRMSDYPDESTGRTVGTVLGVENGETVRRAGEVDGTGEGPSGSAA